MTKTKLFILIPSLRIGGAETVLINFLNLINKDRYDITLGVPLNDGPLRKEVPKNVNVIALTKKEIVIRLANYLYAKYGIDLLIRLLIRSFRGDYDAAICFQDSIFTDYILKSRLNFKNVFSIVQSNYTTYPEKAKYFVGKHKKRVLDRYKKLDKIIAVADTVKKGFEDLYGPHDNLVVNYNPSNSSKVIENSNEELTELISNEQINIIALGRLVPVKGFENLIKAAAILKEQNCNFIIRIIGKGPLFEKLNSLIIELCLESHFKLLGFVENPYPLIKASDIYVMSSFSEGLPTALCEAMFLKLPIVTTNASGCAEVVQDGKYGVMVNQTPESITEGLKLLISSPEQRSHFSLKSVERSKNYLDEKSMDFYNELFRS